MTDRKLARTGTTLWIVGILTCLAVWIAFRGEAPAAGDAFRVRVNATRWILVLTGAYLLFLGWLHWPFVRRQIADLFTTPRHRVNLAVFRIVVFWQVYSITWTSFIALVAALPDELQFPPETGFPDVGPLGALTHWPLHPMGGEQVALWCGVLKVACVAGMIGLFSRTSAMVVSVLFFWVWGSIQWYGKVDHHHHLLWFTLLLAASRSGDALSIDAVVAWWRARKGKDPRPAATSTAYGAPLAFAMVLMGVIYLFPGLWKLTTSGLDWAFSDNPLNTLYMDWHLLGGWTPFFRVDHYPLLAQLAFLGVLLFETSFWLLVLIRRTRMLGASMGFAFHLGSWVMMKISFATLRNCYVVFVDWHRISCWIGARLPWKTIRERAAASAAPATPSPLPVAALVVGTLLVAGNIWAGALKQMDGWPLSCYPRFDGIVGESYLTMRVRLAHADGSERVIVPDDYAGVFGPRWNLMLGRIIRNRDEERRRKQLRALWGLISERDSTLAEGVAVRFTSAETWVRPERWDDPPGEEKLIYEFPLTEVNTGSAR